MDLLSWRPNALTFPSACGDALSSKWVGISYWVGLGLCGLVVRKGVEHAGLVSGRVARGAFPFPHATFNMAAGHWVRGVVRLGN
ncbi:hypothetical protein ACSQ67_023570 [Phaseolus vulgaris]